VGGNAICDLHALADALSARALPTIEWLDLSANELGDDAAHALSAAVTAGGLPALQVLALEQQRPRSIAPHALAALEASLRRAALITEDLEHDLRWCTQ
jgi:hypothetical protein